MMVGRIYLPFISKFYFIQALLKENTQQNHNPWWYTRNKKRRPKCIELFTNVRPSLYFYINSLWLLFPFLFLVEKYTHTKVEFNKWKYFILCYYTNIKSSIESWFSSLFSLLYWHWAMTEKVLCLDYMTIIINIYFKCVSICSPKSFGLHGAKWIVVDCYCAFWISLSVLWVSADGYVHVNKLKAYDVDKRT